ncbi:MAG: alpha/beta hydrolase [Pseudomonadota bacterium]
MRHLLMIHGVGCGGDAWDVMRSKFEAAGWACAAPTLFPDKRTLENPPAALNALRLQDYIDQTMAWAKSAEDQHGRKPVIIGHSMGGLIAQAAAAAGAAEAAIFLTPAPPKDCAVQAVTALITFGNIVAKGEAKAREMPHKVWRRGFGYGVLNRVDPEFHDEIYKGSRFDSGQVYGDLVDGLDVDEAMINVPTLTIGARHDRATPVRGARKMAAKYANSPVPGDYLEYQNSGHWLVDEPATDQMVADILAWLDRKVPA